MLIDSNILIYAGDPQYAFLRNFLATIDPVVSIISYIEVVGYHKFTDEQRQHFEELFDSLPMIFVGQRIAETSVKLRQQRKMTLGDSIIAATAIVEKQILVTRNIDDFKWIAGLELLNPFEKIP